MSYTTSVSTPILYIWAKFLTSRTVIIRRIIFDEWNVGNVFSAVIMHLLYILQKTAHFPRLYHHTELNQLLKFYSNMFKNITKQVESNSQLERSHFKFQNRHRIF
jgi:hypothetical protein